ncbi:hypothetical protein ACGLQO_002133 [Vibrio vulnificus]
MSYSNLKKELESALLITKWSPTDQQLELIAEGLKQLKPGAKRIDVERVVLDVVGSYEGIALEGADNSDLTTLLLLATKPGNPDD